jgi:peptide-methionine (S)-S-oxide reductase
MQIKANHDSQQQNHTQYKTASFAAGCFWGVEAIFEKLEGVIDVASGYSGGQTVNPTYEEVCSDTTGHAETVQITFDPSLISYERLLEVFWKNHNPTTKNQQGVDIGSQYRSIIFYHDEEQKLLAEKSKNDLQDSKYWGEKEIVTEILPAQTFYIAEDYHQDYYKKRGIEPHCVL